MKFEAPEEYRKVPDVQAPVFRERRHWGGAGRRDSSCVVWERRIIGRPLSPSRQARAAGSSTVEGETPYATREAAEYPAGERHGRCGIPAAKIVGDHRRRTFFVISSNSSVDRAADVRSVGGGFKSHFDLHKMERRLRHGVNKRHNAQLRTENWVVGVPPKRPRFEKNVYGTAATVSSFLLTYTDLLSSTMRRWHSLAT